MTTRHGASIPTEAGTGGGGAGLTSVDVAITGYTSDGPLVVDGTITMTEGSQLGNKVKASPADGSNGTPAYRALVAADIPDLSSVYQPLDADLTAIAAVSTAAFGRGLLAETSAANARTTLGAAASGATTSSGLTMATARVLGRTTAATGAIEELTVTSPVALAAGTITTNMNTGKLIGRTTASAGVMEEITPDSTRFSFSAGALDLSTAAKTRQFSFTISSPAVGGVRGPRIPWAATVTRLGSYTDTGTVTFNIEERSSIGSAGTNILSSDQVSDTTGEETTSSFNLGTLTAGRTLYVDISAVASSPTQVAIWLEVTI